MTLPLSPVGVYGKPGPRDEFTVLWADPPPLPAAAVAAASGWLQVALEGTNRAVTAVHRVAGGWWVVRAELEPTTDAVGRPMGFAALGRAAAAPAPDAVPTVLIRFASGPASRNEVPPAPPTSPVAAERTPAAAAAALAVVLRHARVGVRQPGELAAVLGRVGLAACDWVGFLPDQLPVRLPAGVGVVLTPAPPAAAPEVRALVERLGAARVFELPLDHLDAVEPDERAALLHAAAGATPTGLSATAAGWLVDAGVTRATAVGGLSDAGVGDWLRGARADAGDLETLRKRLAANRDDVRRLLRGTADAAARYAVFFPDDAAGMWAVLPPAIAATRDDLTAGRPVTAAAAEALFAAVAGTPLDAAVTPLHVSRAALAGSPSAAARHTELLRRFGVPDAAPVGPPPAALPADVFLGVTPERWLALAPALLPVRGWADWWRNGAARLLAEGRVRADDLVALGVDLADTALLRLAGAPPALVDFVDPNGPRVVLPAPWHPAGGRVLARLARDGALLDRLADPGADMVLTLDWLTTHGGDDVRRLLRIFGGLLGRRPDPGDGPADPANLARAVRLMPRPALLRQLAAWGAVTPGPDRAEAVEALLESRRLTADEVAWFTARLLRFEALPPTPAWPAAELATLFPLLDPVDVVRAVLPRPERDPAEAELLPLVLAALAGRPAAANAFPAAAARVRPDWVAGLAGLGADWAWCAGPEAQLERVRAACRALPRDALTGSDRDAVRALAGAPPRGGKS